MPILLILGLAAVAYFVYAQTANAQSDNGSASNNDSLSPGGVVGSNGLPVNVPNTRGFRNNNPGNLRYIAKNPFNGQVGNDGGYGIYDTLSNGIRAMGKQLDNYVNNGYLSVSQIISLWAPDSENLTGDYISDVSNRMGVDANDPLAWPGDKPDLADAIIVHENGSNPLSQSDLQAYLNS